MDKPFPDVISPPVQSSTSRAERRIVQLKFLRHWWLVGLVLLATTSGASAFGWWWLTRQPTVRNCQAVFWPVASAALRFYCAQELAQGKTLEDLFKAIALVDGLGSNHPLKPMINTSINLWSEQALDLAEEEFHRGQLERALYFAEQIPAQSTAHAQVSQRVSDWKKTWATGQKIYDQAEAALKQDESWRKAFSIMVGLLSVDNRYWAKVRYEALNKEIIQAQKDETQLSKAQRLFQEGQLAGLTEALNIAQDLAESSIFQKSANRLITRIAQSLLQIAEEALDREDLNTALDALEPIPKQVSFWPTVQDWQTIANAMADTWAGTVGGFEAAIKQLQKMDASRPLYAKAQDYISRWQADIAYVQILNTAQATAADGSMASLSRAIATVQQIPRSSPIWETAHQDLEQWRSSLHYQQNLNQIDTNDISNPPTPQTIEQDATRSIFAEPPFSPDPPANRDSDPAAANQPPDSGSGSTASSAVQGLLIEARRLADKQTPSALASAIETANQVPMQSQLRPEADQAMNRWGTQLLEMAASRANYDVGGAIAIAQQIPAFTSSYAAAQQKIGQWQSAQSTPPRSQPKPP